MVTIRLLLLVAVALIHAIAIIAYDEYRHRHLVPSLTLAALHPPW